MRSKPILTFPDTENPEFASLLYSKKEYNKNKNDTVDKENETFADISLKLCKKNDFSLTNNQIFVKNFISPQTPYNSILLYHGVGVGKTCAAISIAEQFLDIFNKKCLVLMPTNLKDNFKKQLFDYNNINQCTSKKYLSKVYKHNLYNKETIEKKVNKLITENYEFMGFLEFANRISAYKLKLSEIKYKNFIKKNYSNRVLIIDEVHNLRSDKEDTQKISPLMLMDVLNNAENIKLVMLTATPMFNGSQEITWIINYILANEKKSPLDNEILFDANGSLTDTGVEILKKHTTGYVSYMRGENPFTFPFRIYPNEVDDDNYLKSKNIPTKDIYENKLETGFKISNKFARTITVSQMSDYQTDIYEHFEEKKDKNKNRNVSNGDNDEDRDSDNDEDRGDEKDKKKENDSYNISTMIQISNIVYPIQKGEEIGKHCYGKTGFYKNFTTNSTGWKFNVAYKGDVFLNKKHLEKYSAKLDRIVDYILNSEGIVYVYSNYVYSSLLPLAIALEHRGFKRSNEANMVKNIKVTADDAKAYGGMTYSFLTKDANIKTDIQKEVDKITALNNINGEKVKVVLGTSVTTEGINFKRIREIHIVEPWYHLNKLEQVIGRAVRMCSHIDLAPEKRNVTIFKHACVPLGGKYSNDPNSKTKTAVVECTDLRIYRIAENKQTNIQKVEKLLIENSIDCNLNYNALVYDTNKTLNIKTSQKSKILKYKIADRLDDKHRSIKCLNSNNDDINATTYTKHFIVDDIAKYIGVFNLVFTGSYIQSYKHILENYKKFISDVNEDVLKFALEDVVKNGTVIQVGDKSGIIIYYSDTYIFQTNDNNDQINNPVIKQNVIRIKNNVDIVTTANEMVNTFRDRVKELEPYKQDFIDRQILYDYFIDRLTYSEFTGLMEGIVNLDKVELTNDYIVMILASLENMGILVKQASGVYFVLNIFSKQIDDIFILDFNMKTYTSGSSLNYIALCNTKAHIDKNKHLAKNMKDFIGFMEFNKKLIIQFKIASSDSENTTGTVCGTGKKREVYENILERFDNFEKDMINKYPHKKVCIVLELFLRTWPEKFARIYDNLLIRDREEIESEEKKKKKKEK